MNERPGEGRVKAVFLFNHRFERNLSTLDQMYGERFPDRHYLMPFSRSDRGDVSRVFETSWNFSGHVAQGARDFVRSNVTHYVFISDDLVVNPRLSATNIIGELGLGPGEGFIKSLASVDALRYRWHRALQATIALRRLGPGFEWRAELPAADEAHAKFASMGVPFSKPVLGSVDEIAFTLRKLAPRVGYLSVPWAIKFYGKPSDYPLLSGYSDFFVVPADAIDRFVHYCGVFAALDIFAEVAVPTALALACDGVRTELVKGESFNEPDARRNEVFPYRGLEFWDPAETPAFAERYGYSRERLLREYPADQLWVHPVKLSQWK